MKIIILVTLLFCQLRAQTQSITAAIKEEAVESYCLDFNDCLDPQNLCQLYCQ